MIIEDLYEGAELYGGSTKNLRTKEQFSYTNEVKDYDLTSKNHSTVEFLLPKPLPKSIFYFSNFCTFSSSAIPIDDIKYKGLWINKEGVLEQDELVSIIYFCNELTSKDIPVIINICKILCGILNQKSICILINGVMVIIDE